MRSVHLAFAALAVAVAGVVLGSGVAGYAEFPGNDVCLLDHGGDPRYRAVPFGTACVAGDGTTVESYGPSTPLWVAWIVALSALVLAALRRPGSARLAGALAAAVLLAVCGVAAHGSTDFNWVLMLGMWLGGPLTFVTLHLLLPAGRRRRLSSFVVAAVLAIAVFLAASTFVFAGGVVGHLGIALGLAVGAALGPLALRPAPRFLGVVVD